MEKLIFETGEIEVAINDDPTRIIRFNPTDLAFVERFENTYKKAEGLAKRYSNNYKGAKLIDDKNKNKEMQTKLLKESNKDARNLVNDLFDDDVADIIFGRIHPLSYTKNKKTILENFLNGLTEFIEKENDKVLDNEKDKIEEYKKEYDRFTS